MFSEIHQLKQIGLKKAQVARKLEIDVKTVNKYWEATPDDFLLRFKISSITIQVPLLFLKHFFLFLMKYNFVNYYY